MRSRKIKSKKGRPPEEVSMPCVSRALGAGFGSVPSSSTKRTVTVAKSSVSLGSHSP